jgi:hypothetical protein
VEMKLRTICLTLALTCLTNVSTHASSANLRAVAARARLGEAAPQRLQRFVSAPLPGGTAAVGQPSTYKPDNLYEYIDGGADVYLLYDFQALLHQELKSGETEVTADIYEMRTPEDAFGIYAAERSPAYRFMTIGVEGYRSKGILNFAQDRYYVKLTGSGANADPAIDQLANTISQRIGGVRLLPALLRKLPQSGLIARSQQYIRKDPLGHAFLAPAYVASYGSTKEHSKLLISVAKDAAGAKLRIDQLYAHFKKTGESAAAPELGQNGMRAKNSFEGRIIACTQGSYVILLINPSPSGAQILKNVAQHLP